MSKAIKITAKKSEGVRDSAISHMQKKEGLKTEDSPVDQVLYLQQTFGNQAVQRLFKSGVIQTKLKIGKPSDKYEQEADRVADIVMRMPEPYCPTCREKESIRRQPEEEKEIQEKSKSAKSPSVMPSLESRINSLKGGGRPLDSASRSFFEPRFGIDLSGVRIHTDSNANHLARSINSKAFTVGQDVVFGSGQYSPGSRTGRSLLAHEMTHVVQQKGLQRQIMRRCDCETIPRASTPTAEQERRIGGAFPNLTSGEWCVTGSRDPSYNCHGFTSGLGTFLRGPYISRNYGDGDNIATVTDFDAFYQRTPRRLRRTPGVCPSNAIVVLYERNGRIKHSALLPRGLPGGCMAESKLGGWERIVHSLSDLEGSSYGHYLHYYVVA